MNNKMEEFFERILKITDTLDTNFKHLTEEVGELSTEILIEQGLSYKESEEGVLAEATDIIVSALAIVANKTDDLSKFYKILNRKISKWENRIAQNSEPVEDISDSRFFQIIDEIKNLSSNEFRQVIINAGIIDEHGKLTPKYRPSTYTGSS